MQDSSAQLIPVEIKREKTTTTRGEVGSGLTISWSNSTTTTISSETLRKHCPCASCLEARGDRGHQKPLTGGSSLLKVIDATKDEETNLTKIWSVGNYAIGISFEDGHDTGIFTYRFLLELSSLNESSTQ